MASAHILVSLLVLSCLFLHCDAFAASGRPPSSLLRMGIEPIQEQFQSNVMTTYGRYPIAIKEGKGCRLVSTEGKEYLDFVAGISTCALGHANQRMIDAVTDQMKKSPPC
mmetsp:Transcript_43285/g.74728  ORF Transcript_43285/g.74728 Transcript_43285/m.74728 type:complete len:110 (+) Transcript_43285:94-423(+)